jgi:hypothetical protein
MSRSGRILARGLLIELEERVCAEPYCWSWLSSSWACGRDDESAAHTTAASTTAPRREPVLIRTRMVIAATAGSEPIATGKVLEASTLGASPFCAGGTILDSHASTDPTYRRATRERKDERRG